ncbi:MAG TPA: CTP synthase [Bacteroidales bacterium]|jgi:CTP synthase|nr:CTP synthase [Bacteroidales bacterium]OQC56679.1 MAG: CTP synthase [Bacteroidetes bacterium ADurb.Bin013]MCZ2316097.1 CTP synthase [Bacteroidales bacterium]NLZ08853.1 CTP synthase [Bacteroidales bacterium]HNR28399.1 CTP synthase [Bacteroidales bacterium]
MPVKYVFVTGGVTSSLGKGTIAASLAKLLQARGLRVTIQKFDPYINVDPGTLDPYEHGECYVTEDGAETDLDLGHYERFLGVYTTKSSNVTTGKIYQTIIDKEREGAYLGKTVQVIPHITDEIKRRMLLLGKTGKYDIIITEIGGTVGDIESLPFVEAVRQLQWELPEENCAVIHLTLVPYLAAAKELKTKPTQHSVRQLQQEGVNPDVIVCRTERPLPYALRKKVALFCNVRPHAVIESLDQKSIYEVPLNLKRQNLDGILLDLLKIDNKVEPNLDAWKQFIDRVYHPQKKIDIALVGKYVELQDAYKSILESFIHAGAANNTRVKVHSIQSEHINQCNVEEKLAGMKGILVAPGFGPRGTDGKIFACKYAREHKIPFLGICLGMQMAVLEFARNVAGIPGAESVEVAPKTEYPVIDLMEDQKRLTSKGGTMRLGAYECKLERGSLAYKIYGKPLIQERHRHRYELNDCYLETLEKAGMKATGKNPETGLIEIMEIPNHPFYIGVQFHPEFKSTPEKPAPLFRSFIAAAIRYYESLNTK